MARTSSTGKPSPGEAGSLKIHAGFFPDGKVLSREIGQNPRRDSEDSRFPESLLEEGSLGGKTHYKPQADLSKGLEGLSTQGHLGEASQLGGPALDGGVYAPFPEGEQHPQECSSSSTGP